jgi:hypothetical protein
VRELFGFERVQALLAGGPDAGRAVEAAVEFGQDDDITVTRLAIGVEVSISLMAPVLA